MIQGHAILTSFEDEPMSKEMNNFGIALKKLNWNVHDIILCRDEDGVLPNQANLDYTQQLWDKVKRLGPATGESGKGEKLLIFYAGYAMSYPDNSAFGTWHTHSSKPLCKNHIARADPEDLFEWLIRSTEHDILFLLNCPFDVGETSLDLIESLPPRTSGGSRTVQYIVLKERYSEHDKEDTCKHGYCEQKGDLLRLPSLRNVAIKALTETLNNSHDQLNRFTAADLITNANKYASQFEGRPWNAMNPQGQDFVLWET